LEPLFDAEKDIMLNKIIMCHATYIFDNFQGPVSIHNPSTLCIIAEVQPHSLIKILLLCSEDICKITLEAS
jgi:hypothetical protein